MHRIDQGRNAFLAAIATLALSGVAFASPGQGASPKAPAARADISGLPLTFEPNIGQGASDVQFLAHGQSYAIALTAQGAELSLGKATAGNSPDEVHLHVQGAHNTAQPTAEQPLPGRVNFYIGSDPSKWHTNVATYGKVRYAGVYPGIDLVYYGTQGKLEYDFAVAPGANPKAIGLGFDGARELRLDSQGNLKVRAPGGELAFLRPVAYQEIGTRRVPVDATYRVSGNTLRFKMGAYDHRERLIIDPILSYFSYLGGSGVDNIGAATPTGGPSGGDGSRAAAIDSAGDLYVTGYTSSTNFPTVAPFAPPPAKSAGGYWAFVTKIAPDAKTLIFSTYLGGSTGYDYAYGIALDTNGNAFVVGNTGSSDFPVTAGAYQSFCSPHWVNGSEESGCSGNIGYAPTDAFVSKFSPSGALLNSTFLGGTATSTAAWAVAVDAAGRPYVVGSTSAGSNVPASEGNEQIGFPTTAGASLTVPPYETSGGNGGLYQLTLNGVEDAFVSVFDPTLSTLVYSSLFGDSQISNALMGFTSASPTYGTAVTLDAAGNFYVAGWTAQPMTQVTAGALQTTVGSCGVLGVGIPTLNGQCGFVFKLSPVGGASPPTVTYGTYLGHMTHIGGIQEVVSIAADAAGDLYVAGFANQSGFPTTTDAYQTSCGGANDGSLDCNGVYIAELNPSGSALLASTYFGCATGCSGQIAEVGPIALDTAGNVTLTGVAAQSLPQVNPLPANAGGYTPGPGNQAPFVAKLNPTLSTLLFSTLLNDGEGGQQSVDGLVIDGSGNIYLAGNVGAPTLAATTSGVFQGTYGGGGTDGFVAKIILTAPTKTTLSASPTSAVTGTAVTFTATVTETTGTLVPAGTVTFSSGGATLGTVSLNGTGIATFTTTSLAAGTDSVTAAYSGNSSNSASTSSAVSVTVTAPAPTASIAVAPASIVLGKSATLTWSSTNATQCSAAGAWTGAQATHGTQVVTPTATGKLTYSLGCANAAGAQASATATLTVTAPAPTVTISVSPTSLTVGQSATITWSSTNATSCTAGGAWSGTQTTSGTATETPSAAGSLSYTLSCTGAGGSANGSAALTVSAASTGTGSHGGGALNWWTLLGLALMTGIARGVLRPKAKTACVTSVVGP
jgi:hypothetical protein